MRAFNTSGPNLPDRHYTLPPERRLPEVDELIEEGAYFVVHAPRQTGKTTAMKALASRLTAQGFAALYATCEGARALTDDVGGAEEAILDAVDFFAAHSLPADCRPPERRAGVEGTRLQRMLSAWAARCPRRIVLILDEVDSLSGNPLKSVLSQLRSGYNLREGAPTVHSVILCGMKDVRDYKFASGGADLRLGSSSPFNIKAESLRLGNFTEADLRELYAQHTAETGQTFSEGALAAAWDLTHGQPWLVNALAREVTRKMKLPLDQEVRREHIEQAKERLIRARQTHLDSLLARLREPRVQRVLEPLLAGERLDVDTFDEDFQYLVDLGLLEPTAPARIANPIYREIIYRVLGGVVEANITAEPRSYVLPDGRLDLRRLLEDFLPFWIQHGEILARGMGYQEPAPMLVLMAWLHRLVNGGGALDREVGVGSGRIDLLVRWPWRDGEGQRHEQREALELKVWRDRDRRGDPLQEGLAQLDAYLDKLGLDTGVLAIFDDRSAAPLVEARAALTTATTPSGREITLLRA